MMVRALVFWYNVRASAKTMTATTTLFADHLHHIHRRQLDFTINNQAMSRRLRRDDGKIWRISHGETENGPEIPYALQVDSGNRSQMNYY
jgi:hypothetical protein